VVAVVLGAVLLGERVPVGPVALAGYLICLLMVGWAAVRLADPTEPGCPPPRPEPRGRSEDDQ
jgi:hypothetical protein